MTANYEITVDILKALDDLVDSQYVKLTTENKNHLGKLYHSDYVLLEYEHHIGFEVFDNEIIVYYFDDHIHFEDYTSSEPDDIPYPHRAIEFLRQLFTTPLVKVEIRKGKKLLRYEWFWQLPDGNMKSTAGPMILHVFSNPFVKPTATKTIWHYSRAYRCFTIESIDDTVSFINHDWNLIIEIHKTGNVYTYAILKNIFSEDAWDLCWIRMDAGVSFYDSEKAAIEAAKAEAAAFKDP